ncbi:GNAT family N-acetyltransferase [Enterococcus durans]|uniref:GNAT family N-acetyltransferase n=1 Tax=Enterococcus durans TaxID=53345 RepID=UPI00188411AD|nr:GNAT family N-acetyltransferase [Enterococcus durans]MBE9887271.1 GNAT family N-acetyltransferase [Enterococcus durans]
MELLIDRNLIFAQHQRIETERLILRPVTLKDTEDMYEYAKDEETTHYVFPTHQTIADTKKGIANYFMAAPFGKYGIELKSNHKMIGTIDLRINETQDNAELGYALNKAYWGNGYTPEASKALLTLGFEELALVRIFAYHDVENPKSGRVMEKIGMKKEGIIPDARRWKGEIVSIVLRGITKKEWQEQQHKKTS